MSHHHSFNTQPRKRIRQMAALQRWNWRLDDLGIKLNKIQDDHDRDHYSNCLDIAKNEIAILKSKGITI